MSHKKVSMNCRILKWVPFLRRIYNSRWFRELLIFLRRDQIILYKLNQKTKNGYINLHWWGNNCSKGDNEENLGDFLSTIVCSYMIKLKNLGFDTYVRKTKHLYGVGSIIDGGFQNATIWGSGLIEEPMGKLRLNPLIRKLDIRAVRGPETCRLLIEKGYVCPDKYGDPAILMPLIYSPKTFDLKKDFVVVLHHASLFFFENNLDIKTTDYKFFIDIMFNSKKVISSSLHGIVLAEAYGVQAVLLDDVATQKSLLKFDDYYFSTNRFKYPIAKNINEAVSLTPICLPDNLDELRKNLIDSFPYDLWV